MYVTGRYPNGTKVLHSDNMVVTARKEGSKLLIRVDDGKVPEFWMQIEFNENEIVLEEENEN